MSSNLAVTRDLSNILQNTIENLVLAEKQIRDKECSSQEKDDFTLDSFWKTIDAIAKKLSFECTKLCLLFVNTPPPSSSEISSLLVALENTVVAFIPIFFKLSLTHGKLLHHTIGSCIIEVIEATRSLVTVIKDAGGQAAYTAYRIATGAAWEGCTILKTCSRDCKGAVMKGLQDQSGIVNDAFSELSEAIEGDGGDWDDLGLETIQEDDDIRKWTNEDKEFMSPSVALIKAAKILFKRIISAVEGNAACESPEKIHQLDQLYDDCKPISDVIDTIILELYPPLDRLAVEEQSQKLASVMLTALKTAATSHICGEEQQPQLEFLQKAIHHNLDKLKYNMSH